MFGTRKVRVDGNNLYSEKEMEAVGPAVWAVGHFL